MCTNLVFVLTEQNFYKTFTELLAILNCTRNSANNLLSYFGLIDVRMSAFEKYLPIHSNIRQFPQISFPSSFAFKILEFKLKSFMSTRGADSCFAKTDMTLFSSNIQAKT